MTALAEFVASTPLIVDLGIFLSGVALLYLVVRRTIERRGED